MKPQEERRLQHMIDAITRQSIGQLEEKLYLESMTKLADMVKRGADAAAIHHQLKFDLGMLEGCRKVYNQAVAYHARDVLWP